MYPSRRGGQVKIWLYSARAEFIENLYAVSPGKNSLAWHRRRNPFPREAHSVLLPRFERRTNSCPVFALYSGYVHVAPADRSVAEVNWPQVVANGLSGAVQVAGPLPAGCDEVVGGAAPGTISARECARAQDCMQNGGATRRALFLFLVRIHVRFPAAGRRRSRSWRRSS